LTRAHLGMQPESNGQGKDMEAEELYMVHWNLKSLCIVY
jgi:hypothetical protein